MKKVDYADFDYVINGIIADLCQLSRARKRKSKEGWNANVEQIIEKIKLLQTFV